MILELKGIYKEYLQGKMKVPVLKDVNFSMEEGEYVAIMGPSGSGKTTLMNIIGCLDKQTEGTFFLDGQDIYKLSESKRIRLRNREIGFIFQGFNLIQNLTALENVELPLVYRGVGKKERRELSLKSLDKVGLSGRLDHKPAQMSGGQQQRVAIARAIAQAPPIILADEPTGNLDSHSTGEIMQILRELHKEGRTVILITHDNEIAQQADRVIRINDGKVVEDTNRLKQNEEEKHEDA